MSNENNHILSQNLHKTSYIDMIFNSRDKDGNNRKQDTTEMNAAKEMFKTLQKNMETLQLQNKKLYQENIKLKTRTSKRFESQDFRDSREIVGTLNTAVTTNAAGTDSISEQSTQKEDDQVKFLKNKLQRMNKTLRILVRFNRDMADELANFKANEQLLMEYISKVDQIDKKYDTKMRLMKNDYENKISFLERKIEAIGHHHRQPRGKNEDITDVTNERNFWKEQTIRLSQKLQTNVDSFDGSNHGSRMNSQDLSGTSKIGSIISNIKRGAMRRDNYISNPKPGLSPSSKTSYSKKGRQF